MQTKAKRAEAKLTEAN